MRTPQKALTIFIALSIIYSSTVIAQKKPTSLLGVKFKSKQERREKRLSASIHSYVDGIITNEETKEGLGKAFVYLPSKKGFVTSNQYGNFTMKADNSDGQIMLLHPDAYSNYYNIQIESELYTPVGAVRLKPNMIGEKHQLSLTERTLAPSKSLAYEQLATLDILKYYGNNNFNSLINKNASIYQIENGGGYGSSTISMRGFDESLTQIIFNGINLNNPETGEMNTYLFTGMTDWARKVDITRGLGSSQLSTINPAGMINILGFMPKQNEGIDGVVSYGANNQFKTAVTLHSGVHGDGNLATSLKLDRTSSNGFAENTNFQSYGAYLTLYAKTFSNHQFNATSAFKSWNSDQRVIPITIADANSYGIEYNGNWGKYNNKKIGINSKGLSSLTSFSHRVNLTRYKSISSQIYFQYQTSEETLPLGKIDGKDIYNFERTNNGLLNINGVYSSNQAVKNIDSHNGIIRMGDLENILRIGAQSKYIYELNKTTSINLAFDYDYYKNHHFGVVDNLLGASTYYDEYTKATIESTGNEKINHNYSAIQHKAGLTAKIEQNERRFNTFAELAVNNKNMMRNDIFLNTRSNNTNSIGWRANFGLMYIMTEKSSIKLNANASGTPENFNIIFPTFSNVKNEFAKNRNLFSGEFAYIYKSNWVLFELRGYANYLNNLSKLQEYGLNADDDIAVISGINELRFGLEINTQIRYGRNSFIISANGSEQKYRKNTTASFYTNQGELLKTISMQTEKKYIGNTSPLNAYAQNNFYITKGLEFNVSYYYLHGNYTPISARDNLDALQNRLDWFGILGAGLNYFKELDREGSSIHFFCNANNILDSKYINYCYRINSASEYNNSLVQYGLGLNWNLGIQYNF